MGDKPDTVFKNRRVEVAYSKTINTGNFNSERVHAGFSGEIKDDVDIDKAYDEAYKIAEDVMKNELKELKIDM